MRLGVIIIFILICLIAAIGFIKPLFDLTQPKKVLLDSTPIPILSPSPSPLDISPVETSSSASPSAQPIIKKIRIEELDYQIKPNIIRVNLGEKVILTVNNLQGNHNFVLPGYGIVTATTNNQGVPQIAEFIADTRGEFKFYCSSDNHLSLGMEGKLIVE